MLTSTAGECVMNRLQLTALSLCITAASVPTFGDGSAFTMTEEARVPPLDQAQTTVVARGEGFEISLVQTRPQLTAHHIVRPTSMVLRTDTKTGDLRILDVAGAQRGVVPPIPLQPAIVSPTPLTLAIGPGAALPMSFADSTYLLAPPLPPAPAIQDETVIEGSYAGAASDDKTVFVLARTTKSVMSHILNNSTSNMNIDSTQLELLAIPLAGDGERPRIDVPEDIKTSWRGGLEDPPAHVTLTVKEGVITVGDKAQFKFDGKTFTKVPSK
jgi:hypothetical protein